METKAKQILSFCVFDKIKIIPLREYSKIPALKNWQNYQHIPYPHLVQLVKTSNYGLVCGKVSNGLWVIDCDNAQTVIKIENLLIKYNIETFSVKTKRGKHFYFKSPTIIKTLKAEAIDIKAEGSYIVGPLCFNTNQEMIYRIDQNKPIKNLYPYGKDKDFFTDLQEILGKKLHIRPYLSKKLKQRLQNEGIEHSTSEQEFNIMLELISKKYTKKEIYHIFQYKLIKTSHFWKKENEKQQLEYFENTYKKAFQAVGYNKYKENKQKNNLSRYQNILLEKNIPNTSKKLMMFLLNQIEGKEHIKISYRQILKGSSIGSQKTIKKHLDYLIEQKFISKVQTSVYKIEYQAFFLNNTPISNTSFSRTLSLDIASLLRKKQTPYLFSHGYLGSSIYLLLSSILYSFSFRSFTIKELNMVFPSKLSSLYRYLKKMQDHSLLIKESNFYRLNSSFMTVLYNYSQSFSLDMKEKHKIAKINHEQNSYEYFMTLKLAYYRKHFTPSIWNKIQFSMELFDLDYTLLLEIFSQEYKKDDII